MIAQGIMEAIKAVNGDVEKATRFLEAAKKAKVTDTPQGPVGLDETGNAVHNVSIRRGEPVPAAPR